jgi:uncharacterized protein (DUF169 family)
LRPDRGQHRIKGVAMSIIQQNLSIFNKFGFKNSPVGVKFLFRKPEGLKRLDKQLALCEMMKETQQRDEPFYADLDNLACKPSAYVWGHEISEIYKSGLFGVGLQAFKEARANQKIYQYVRRLAPGTVNYMAFSPLDKLPFEPDILLILADDTTQVEIILRGLVYTDGEMWSSEMTSVLGCSWLFAYPFVTGKVNYMTTGLSMGMKSKKVFPESKQLISIPYNWLPTITRNLNEMEWVLPAYAVPDLREFIAKIYHDMGLTPS